jgi:hypothetical protein
MFRIPWRRSFRHRRRQNPVAAVRIGTDAQILADVWLEAILVESDILRERIAVLYALLDVRLIQFRRHPNAALDVTTRASKLLCILLRFVDLLVGLCGPLGFRLQRVQFARNSFVLGGNLFCQFRNLLVEQGILLFACSLCGRFEFFKIATDRVDTALD